MERVIGAVLLTIFLSLADSWAALWLVRQDKRKVLDRRLAARSSATPSRKVFAVPNSSMSTSSQCRHRNRCICKRKAQPLSSGLIPGVASCF